MEKKEQKNQQATKSEFKLRMLQTGVLWGLGGKLKSLEKFPVQLK